MKKTYIAPEAFSVCLTSIDGFMEFIIAGSPAGEGQFTKEFAGDGDDEATVGSKNIWDEEW